MKGKIDAGHGGKDPGAIGQEGTEESAVALAVSKLVASKLRAEGFHISESRDTDSFVSLNRRSETSNRFGSDFFVSIHCNAFNRKANGIETYHFRGSKVSPPLAKLVQDQLIREFPSHKNRGVKSAGFSVLRKTNCPAILVELEFIDVVEMERLLGSPSGQERYAEAITKGVVNWAHAQDKSLKNGLPAVVSKCVCACVDAIKPPSH